MLISYIKHKENQVLNSTEYYDDVRDERIISTTMVKKRFRHNAVALRENIYVVGGWNFDDGYLSTAVIFDTKTRQITSIPSVQA